MSAEPRPFADGLRLPECPRWRDASLWLVDMWAHEVLRYDLDGTRQVIHRFPDDEDPGGIGWLPDGRLLVAGMEGRVVYRLENDRPTVHADLHDLAPFQLNDMVVAADGTAYVSQFGYDMWGGGAYTNTVLIRVTPDGTATAVADDLASPNGMAITPDGATLVVAEPGGARLSRFRITPDGLANRELVPLEKSPAAPYVTPDGICLDAEGAVWAADPMGGRVIRVLDRRIEREVAIGATHPLACVLGGPERRTLFVCTGEQVSKPTRTAEATGRIVTLEVDVPGAGIP